MTVEVIRVGLSTTYIGSTGGPAILHSISLIDDRLMSYDHRVFVRQLPGWGLPGTLRSCQEAELFVRDEEG